MKVLLTKFKSKSKYVTKVHPKILPGPYLNCTLHEHDGLGKIMSIWYLTLNVIKNQSHLNFLINLSHNQKGEKIPAETSCTKYDINWLNSFCFLAKSNIFTLLFRCHYSFLLFGKKSMEWKLQADEKCVNI